MDTRGSNHQAVNQTNIPVQDEGNQTPESKFKFQRERDYVFTINTNQNSSAESAHLNDIGLIGTKSIFQNHVKIICNDQAKKENNFDKAFILGNMTEKDLETWKKAEDNPTLIQIVDPTISRFHLKVELVNQNKEIRIRDLGSINGTYLCNPDDPADYDLEIEKEFAIGDTTMSVTKKNTNSSFFGLCILDGFLSGLEFKCKCNSQGSFFFRKGDLRKQLPGNDEYNEQLFILDEENNKNVRSQVEIKWDEKTKKLRVQKNDKIGFWIRISPTYFPGQRVKTSDQAVLRIGSSHYVYINHMV